MVWCTSGGQFLIGSAWQPRRFPYHENFESYVQVYSCVHLAWTVVRFRGAFKVWRLEVELLCWYFDLAWSIWHRSAHVVHAHSKEIVPHLTSEFSTSVTYRQSNLRDNLAWGERVLWRDTFWWDTLKVDSAMFQFQLGVFQLMILLVSNVSMAGLSVSARGLNMQKEAF